MQLDSFKAEVREYFGPELEHATPENVRQFLDRVQQRMAAASGDRAPFLVDEQAQSYEQILRQFFSRILDYPPEQAVVALWLVAFETSYATLMELQSATFAPLFAGIGLDDDSGADAGSASAGL